MIRQLHRLRGQRQESGFLLPLLRTRICASDAILV
jgi:hypothetical protein